jgi:hypothetical protein
MSIYLSPTNSIDPRYLDSFGYLVSPRKTGVMSEVKNGALFAIDNDCFNGGLDITAWVQTLALYWPYRNNCLFVNPEDVLADYQATLKKFYEWLPLLKALNYRVALVTQDGLTPDNVPWADIDALFIGGTDKHKLGQEAGQLIAVGKEKEKWIHIGRVNSPERILKFWRADSWDGKTIACEPRKSVQIGQTVRLVNEMQKQKRLF